jgi:hypothetical protein
MSLSDEEALLGSLNASQRNSLETFAAVTNRDPHSADSLQALQESGWDVQAAISRVYDGAPDTHAPEEADDDDDNHHDHDPPLLSAGSPRRRATQQTGGLGTGAIGLYYLRQVSPHPTPGLTTFPRRCRNSTKLFSCRPSHFRLRSSPTRPPCCTTSAPRSLSFSRACSDSALPRPPRSDLGTRSPEPPDRERPSLPPRRPRTLSGASNGSRLSRGGGNPPQVPLRLRLPPRAVSRLVIARGAAVPVLGSPISTSAVTTKRSALRGTRCASSWSC